MHNVSVVLDIMIKGKLNAKNAQLFVKHVALKVDAYPVMVWKILFSSHKYKHVSVYLAIFWVFN
jgi:hypothetical protein